MSYTPEVWRAEQRSYGYPDYKGGPIVRLWDVVDTNNRVVLVGTIYPNNEETARLAAAAPAMYEALEELFGHLVVPAQSDSAYAHVYLKAQSALALARAASGGTE